MSIRLYVEGGGDSKVLRRACAKGFRMFMERVGLTGRLPRIVACGSREHAYQRFSITHNAGEGTPVLVVDAEGPVTVAGRWEHLLAGWGWARPVGAKEEQCHLMVEVMESWLLADREALASFYGQSFNPNALPGSPDVEQVSKRAVFRGLERATRNTQKGGLQQGLAQLRHLECAQPDRC